MIGAASYAGIKCSGRTLAGGPCRRLTRGTVEVAGVQHAACPAHEAQVEARETELAVRVAECANDVDPLGGVVPGVCGGLPEEDHG